LFFVEPQCAFFGFPHFFALRGGKEGQRQAKERGGLIFSGKVDAGNDVAPLVATAHLQTAVVFLCEHKKVVGLQEHIRELEEAEVLFSVQAGFDGFCRQHTIDREMFADITQKRNQIEGREPVSVVDNKGRGGVVLEKMIESAGEVANVVVYGVFVLYGSGLVFAGGVADEGRAAAEDNDRGMPVFLEQTHQHDGEQMPGMQLGGSGIKANIRAYRLARHEGV